MATFEVRNPGSDYIVDDLGQLVEAGETLDILPLHGPYALLNSQDLDTALSLGNLIRVRNSSDVTYAVAYDDLIITQNAPHISASAAESEAEAARSMAKTAVEYPAISEARSIALKVESTASEGVSIGHIASVAGSISKIAESVSNRASSLARVAVEISDISEAASVGQRATSLARLGGGGDSTEAVSEATSKAQSEVEVVSSIADIGESEADLAASIARVTPTYVLYVGPTRAYTTIGAAITAASGLSPSESQHVSIEVDNGTYTESFTLPDYVSISGDAGLTIEGTVTYSGSNVAYLHDVGINSINAAAIIMSGTGNLYVYAIKAQSVWTDDTVIQSVVNITNGIIYINLASYFILDHSSAYATNRTVCVYNLNGSNQAQIRSEGSRHIVNADAANFNITVAHDTNTNTGNRIELSRCINYLTADHATDPANRMTIVNHEACAGYSTIDNNKTFAYAPNDAGNAYFMPAHCYNGVTWDTISLTKCLFQWADLDASNIYLSAATHSVDAVLLIDCYFNTATDIFPGEYTNDGTAGSIFAVLSNTYGSLFADGVGGNVAITNKNQNITAGWTFQTASPEFQISPVFANDIIWLGRNSGGGAEAVMWPRASDNNTYMNYGSGGYFYLRNNSSVVQYSFTDTALDITNANLDNVGRISFEQRTSNPSSNDDGDMWYRYDNATYLLRNRSRNSEIQVLEHLQCVNQTAVDINTATAVAIPWDVEMFKDSLFTHDVVTNNTRIYVEDDCVCTITFSIVGGGATGRRNPQAKLRIDGTNEVTRGTAHAYVRNANNPEVNLVMPGFDYRFNSGEYFEIVCYRSGTQTGTLNTVINESFINVKLVRYL